MPHGYIRSPGTARLSKEKFEQLTEAQWQRFPPVRPEFVVEARAPLGELATLWRKMEDYLIISVQLGTLIDPAATMATIYRLDQALEETMGFERELSGEPVLPGFTLGPHCMR